MERLAVITRKSVLFLTVFCLGCAGTFVAPAQAQDEATDEPVVKKKKKNKKKVKRKKRKKPVVTDETATDVAAEDPSAVPSAPADAKSFEILANAGLAPQPLLGVGATVGMFVGTGHSAIEASFLASSGKVDPVSLSSTFFGVRYRQGLGSIPYIAGGLGLKTLTAKWNTLNVAQTEEFPSGASSTSLVLDLAVGAQFRFGAFAIGADAVGVMYPVTKLSKKETLPEGTFDQADYDAQREKFDKNDGMSLILGRVGIGFVF